MTIKRAWNEHSTRESCPTLCKPDVRLQSNHLIPALAMIQGRAGVEDFALRSFLKLSASKTSMPAVMPLQCFDRMVMQGADFGLIQGAQFRAAAASDLGSGT